jgi:hypothetical protein
MNLSEIKTVEELAPVMRTLIGQDMLAGAYLSLPVLKGFWPMTATGSAQTPVRDISGNGLDLINTGQAQLCYAPSNKKPPAIFFGAAGTDRLYRADEAAFSTSWTAAGITGVSRGLTAGAWVRPLDIATATETIIGQWDNGANDRSWCIQLQITTGYPNARISSNGTATDGRTYQTALENNKWYFLCLQASPSAQDDYLRMWVDDDYESVAHGETDINNSAANFGIGHSYNSGSPAAYYEGYLGMSFLCGGNIRASNILRLYNMTKHFFKD